MKKIYFFTFLLMILLITACRKEPFSRKEPLTSADVSKDRIYASIYYTYNDASNSTIIRSYFSLDGPYGDGVPLAENSSIEVNGTQMSLYGDKWTASYRTSFMGLMDSITIDWKITEGNDTYHFINNARMPAEVSATTQYINAWNATAWGYDLHFDGDSLAVDEAMELVIDVVVQDTSFSITIRESTQGRDYVHIPALDMQRLYGYQPTFYLIRQSAKDLEEKSNAGGRIYTTYISTTNAMYIQ